MQPTKSAAKEITEYINEHKNITCDVGQVVMGNACFMTADAPLTYLLRNYKQEKWVNADTECESGCGILPFEYMGHVYTHALQWAIGLEIFLLSKDPWRIVLSTDHPNGGSFANYPLIIKLLNKVAYPPVIIILYFVFLLDIIFFKILLIKP